MSSRTKKTYLAAYVGRCLCLPLCMQHGEQHVVRYQDTCMVENRELDRKRRMPKSYNSLGRELAFNASHCLSPHTTKRTRRPLPYAVFLSESFMIQKPPPPGMLERPLKGCSRRAVIQTVTPRSNQAHVIARGHGRDLAPSPVLGQCQFLAI